MAYKAPLNKRRKLTNNWEIELSSDDDDDIMAIDINDNNDNNHNSNDKKKLYSPSDKLSYWGAAIIERPNGGIINMIVIRHEIHKLASKQSYVILNMMERDMKRRALGMDVCYEDKKTKTGKVKKVKLELLDNLDWAPVCKSNGGGGTGYTILERTLIADGACVFVKDNWKVLKCKKELGILSVGNIGKVFRSLVAIAYTLKYGQKYPDMMRKRSLESVKKRLKYSMEKKSMTPDGIKIREMFSDWGDSLNVETTSYVYFFFVFIFSARPPGPLHFYNTIQINKL